MLILGIESSCDETAAAVCRGREVCSNVVLSQVDTHAIYGADVRREDLDAVAVTYAPGLIGALLVGVGFAKAAAFGLGIPLIPVHHIRGHIAANYIAFPELAPPFLCMVASGGHTLIVDVRGYTDFEILGSTRDDAAGEAFDKCARVLGLPYPGGALLDKLSQKGDPDKYKLPRAKIDGAELDMSFSGLKTAVINRVHNAEQKGEELDVPSLAASFSKAVTDAVVPRVLRAAELRGRDKIAVAGGVAANSSLRAALCAACEDAGASLYLPPLSLCGDNGAMIACQGYYEYLAGNTAGPELNAYATMPVDQTKKL